MTDTTTSEKQFDGQRDGEELLFVFRRHIIAMRKGFYLLLGPMAAEAALAAKRGERDENELKGASRSMEQSMSEKELEDMASTKRKGKPDHVTSKD